MSYAEVPVHVELRSAGTWDDIDLTVPVKLYRHSSVQPIDGKEHDDRHEAVLVCWVNESRLGSRPLCVLGQVLDSFFGTCRESVEVAVIGPAGSDGLLAMAADYAHWSQWNEEAREACETDHRCDSAYWRDGDSPYRHVIDAEPYFGRYRSSAGLPAIYSARATVDRRTLRGARHDGHHHTGEATPRRNSPDAGEQPCGRCLAGRTDPIQAGQALDQFISGSADGDSGIRLVRTIGTDRLLAKALKEELNRRGAWPGAGDECLVLLTERDTIYGESLPLAFRQVCSHLDDRPDRLQVFKYLQGVDGQIPGSEEDKSREQRADGGDGQPTGRYDRPAGRSQRDYLRRIERELTELRRHGREIKAIGVLGTDVYDKLLVLRALRPRFREVPFFTTDLEAELAHEEESDYTQNLIVATHFGLRLRRQPVEDDRDASTGCDGNHRTNHRTVEQSPPQHDVPAFRDSYQTSTYLATMLALRDSHILDEIDDGDPWDLRGDECRSNDMSHLFPLLYEVGRGGLYQLAEPSQGASAYLHPVFERRDIGWVDVFFCSLVALLAAWGMLHSRRMRRALHSGFASRLRGSESDWLSAAPAWIAVAVAILFVVLISTAYVSHADRVGGEPFEFFHGVSVWPTTFLRFLAICFSLTFMWLVLAREQETVQQIDTAFFSGTAAARRPERAWWGQLLTWWPEVRRESPAPRPILLPTGAVGAESEVQTDSRARETFSHYAESVRPRWRLLRAGLLTALFQGASIAAADATGRNAAQAWLNRGARVHWPVFAGSVLLNYMLIFLVADGLYHSWRLTARLLREGGDTSLEPVQSLQRIQIAARETQAVGKALLYPFVVLGLMLLARIPLFDGWHYSVVLIAFVALAMLVLVVPAIGLHVAAWRGREETLSGRRSQEQAAHSPEQQQALSAIEQEDRGAFRPWAQNPLLGIPLGGAVVAALSEMGVRYM